MTSFKKRLTCHPTFIKFLIHIKSDRLCWVPIQPADRLNSPSNNRSTDTPRRDLRRRAGQQCRHSTPRLRRHPDQPIPLLFSVAQRILPPAEQHLRQPAIQPGQLQRSCCLEEEPRRLQQPKQSGAHLHRDPLLLSPIFPTQCTINSVHSPRGEQARATNSQTFIQHCSLFEWQGKCHVLGALASVWPRPSSIQLLQMRSGQWQTLRRHFRQLEANCEPPALRADSGVEWRVRGLGDQVLRWRGLLARQQVLLCGQVLAECGQSVAGECQSARVLWQQRAVHCGVGERASRSAGLRRQVL